MRTSRVITAMTHSCARSFATGGSQIPFAFRALLLAAVVLVAGGRCAAALPEGALAIDLPAGGAETTLKLLAEQAKVEVVFSTEIAARVRTLPVKGFFTALDAAMRMLADTPLRATQRDAASAIVVSRRTPTRTAEDNGRGEKSSDPPRVGPPSSQASELKTSPNTQTSTPNPMKNRTLLAALAGWLALSPTADAQTPAPTAGATGSANPVVKLSPFEVKTDTGYLASGTLAGSRLNTSLFDTPSAISVMTKDFLDDIAATSVQDALGYALNAEYDASNNTGNPVGSSDLPFAIRGFTGASLGRNYFQWGLESDTYNTERLDFSRGPNSILFGTGAPGGIINTTTKRAVFGREVREVGLRVGSWDERRATFDYGRQIGRTLALRVNGVAHHKESWQDFVKADRKGAALAMTYRPFAHTEIRFDGEYGEYDRVTAFPFLPSDFVTPWIAAGKPISNTYGTVVPGTARTTARAYVYDIATGTVQSWFGSVSTLSAGTSPFQKQLTNFSVLPLKANITGDGNQSNSRFLATALFLEQKVGPFWFEAVVNRQDSGRLWLSGNNSSDAAVRADANAFLPNGRPNPNVGKIYVDAAQGFQTTQDNVTDDFRASGTYTLDLKGKNPWLGTYAITGLVSRRVEDSLADTLTEVNTTPAGDAIYPRDLNSGNNLIYRRVYLDPFGSGPKGGVDARHYQFAQGGVTSGYRRRQNQGVVSRQQLDTRMVAGQATLLKDRLVVTGGVRKDEQEIFGGTATQNPITTEWSRQTLNPNSTDSAGITRTFGSVLHVTSWASAFYNQSNNFTPQTGLTVYGTELGPQRGVGKDYGVKLRLFDGRLYASLSRYETSSVNGRASINREYQDAVNEINKAIGDPARFFGTEVDGIDNAGKGHELEITANPTRQWRFTLNLAQTQQITDNNRPRMQAYFAERRSGWLAKGNLLLLPPLNSVPPIDPKTGAPSTVATAVAQLDDFVPRVILVQNGFTRQQLREYTGSGFAAYTFKSDKGLLNGLTAGAGVRYRGAPVVGNVSGASVYGKAETLVNVLLRKSVPIFGRPVRFQANFDNILNVNDPILVNADAGGQYRWLYPNPFRWSLSATTKF